MEGRWIAWHGQNRIAWHRRIRIAWHRPVCLAMSLTSSGCVMANEVQANPPASMCASPKYVLIPQHSKSVGQYECRPKVRYPALWIGKVFEVSCIFLLLFLFQAGRFLKKSNILLRKKISGTLLEILKNMIHKLASK